MNVLLKRRNDGVGDWLFMLACIKHYNRAHPWMHFYVDFEVAARENVESPLPPIIRELYEQSDVTWYVPELDRYDVVVPHVVYRMHDERTYIESMLAQLVTLTGRDVKYDPELVPRFIYPELEQRPRNYVALVSRGKRTTSFKDWPRSRFEELGDALRADGFEIMQIGREGDPRLASSRGTPAAIDCSLDTVAGALAGARLFVGLENGLAVLASWLGTPTIVIYQGGDFESAGRRAKRWCGPVVAKMNRPGVADVLVEARKVLKC